jgi:hypothetical protein
LLSWIALAFPKTTALADRQAKDMIKTNIIDLRYNAYTTGRAT